MYSAILHSSSDYLLWDLSAYGTIVAFTTAATVTQRRRPAATAVANTRRGLAAAHAAALRLRLQPSLLLSALDAIAHAIRADAERAEATIARAAISSAGCSIVSRRPPLTRRRVDAAPGVPRRHDVTTSRRPGAACRCSAMTASFPRTSLRATCPRARRCRSRRRCGGTSLELRFTSTVAPRAFGSRRRPPASTPSACVRFDCGSTPADDRATVSASVRSARAGLSPQAVRQRSTRCRARSRAAASGARASSLGLGVARRHATGRCTRAGRRHARRFDGRVDRANRDSLGGESASRSRRRRRMDRSVRRLRRPPRIRHTPSPKPLVPRRAVEGAWRMIGSALSGAGPAQSRRCRRTNCPSVPSRRSRRSRDRSPRRDCGLAA
jgi:hypothetical protein